MPKMKPISYYSSQRDDTRKGDRAPPVPHLAVRVNETTIAPLEPGVHMFIVKDPAKINGVFELVFEKIKFKDDAPVELHFIVPQNNGSRKCIMTIAWLGDYKEWMSRNRDAEVAAENKTTRDAAKE